MVRRWLAPRDRSAVVETDEAFRVLRSNINVALNELEKPIVIITSAQPGEGKTMTTVNLGRAMALAGQRAIVVDVDLRHPDAHRQLGAHNEVGLTDVLLDRRPLDECLQFVEIGRGLSDTPRGLFFLGTGVGVGGPTELLATGRMSRLLNSLASQADIVLLDAPPVLPVADTLVIGRMAAGAVLVVEARRTPIDAVRQAKDALTRNQTRLLGLVVNKLEAPDMMSSFGYGEGYGYRGDEIASNGDSGSSG